MKMEPYYSKGFKSPVAEKQEYNKSKTGFQETAEKLFKLNQSRF